MLMGPNCIGVMNLANGLCMPFPLLARRDFLHGPHSLVAQSGGVMLYLADLLSEERLGVHVLVSEGNTLDVDEADLVAALAEDPGTRVIFLYLEGIRRGRALAEAAARSPKPVVALKANVGPGSAQIARSHTAALANDERVVDAAFRQAGILRLQSLEQFTVAAKAFALPPLRGDGIAVACMSGGISVVAADACARHGLSLPPLPADLLRGVEARGRGGVIRLVNPMDLGDIHDTGAVLEALEAALSQSQIHGVAFCLPSPASAGVIQGGLPVEEIVRRLRSLCDAFGKPVALSFFAGRRAVEPVLGKVDFPIFWSMTESIEALALQRAFWRGRDRAKAFAGPGVGAEVRRRGLPAVLGGLEGTPSALHVSAVLADRGIPMEEISLATSPEEAEAIADRLGYPVVLKLVSPQISHKTDVGGVLLDLATRQDVHAGFRRLIDTARAGLPGAEVQGVGVQRMRRGGHEVIIGAKRDPAFGPLVLFGLGGVWVEALGDVAIRLAPIGREDAMDMIGEIRGSALLRGLRGAPPADVEAIADILLSVSRLMVETPEIQELDLNPVMVWRDKAAALDARMMLGTAPDIR
ncbi:MAG: acetate--CoA ligase family protein [Candidatus Rokubacteria bacterium]|nr:acetate--CoA ligase family protein [Candidatus Rokubacteria bacterium]